MALFSARYARGSLRAAADGPDCRGQVHSRRRLLFLAFFVGSVVELGVFEEVGVIAESKGLA